MKRNREDEDKGPPSPDRKRKKNDPPLPGKPSYVHVGTFKVGERSFAKRQRVPSGMKTDVPVWAVRVREEKSRRAGVTKYIVFTPTDVEVSTLTLTLCPHPYPCAHALLT